MEIIRETFDLPTIRIWLDRPAGNLAVFEGVRGDDAAFEIARCSIDELGVPLSLADAAGIGDGDFRLPEPVLQELKSAAQALGTSSGGPHQAVWLELASPRGCLYIAPWERLLRALDRPVIRIPSFLLRPQRAYTLEVALAATSDDGVEPGQIIRLARTWIERTGPPCTVHLFADTTLYRELRSDPRAQLDGLQLHNPYQGRAEGAGDPWLSWISTQLSGSAVDVLHLVNRGALVGGRGCVSLLYGTSEDPRVRRLVSGVDIAGLMADLGAWGLVLSGPPNRACMPALRDLADTVSRAAPGVVVVQDLGQVHEASDTADATRMVAGTDLTGALPSVTAWVHPGYLDLPQSKLDRLLVTADGHSELLGQSTLQVLQEDQTPTWLASGSRFIETQQAKWMGDLGPSVLPQEGTADPDAVAALSSVARLLDRHAAQYLTDRGPSAAPSSGSTA